MRKTLLTSLFALPALLLLVAWQDAAAPAKDADQAVIAAQLPSYPLTTCIVSGEELGADSVDFLYGVRLVRVCCKRCAGAVKKDPAKHLATLDAAASKGNSNGG